MNLTNDVKTKLDNAKSKAEEKAILDNVKRGAEDAGLNLDDAELDQVAGGFTKFPNFLGGKYNA